MESNRTFFNNVKTWKKTVTNFREIDWPKSIQVHCFQPQKLHDGTFWKFTKSTGFSEKIKDNKLIRSEMKFGQLLWKRLYWISVGISCPSKMINNQWVFRQRNKKLSIIIKRMIRVNKFVNAVCTKWLIKISLFFFGVLLHFML